MGSKAIQALSLSVGLSGSPQITSVKPLAGLRNKYIRVRFTGVNHLETAFVNLYKDKMAGTIN